MKTHSVPRAGGFTLLEVLIAIMILVLAVAAILPLFALGTMAHKRGMDQAHLAWLAPRIAARIQQRNYDRNPDDIRGFVKEVEDGFVLIEETKKKKNLADGATYRFSATFKPLKSGNAGGPASNSAFHLTVTVSYLEEGDEQGEIFKTVVLRKLRR